METLLKLPLSISLLLLASLGLIAAAGPRVLQAQAAAPQAGAGARLIGTVVHADGNSLSLKLESGGQATVAVTAETRVVRTAPGAKTLAGATLIQLSDLAPGDRILVRTTPDSDPAHPTATAIIAMKQADIAQAHEQSEQDWQHRGISGVVKSIDRSATPPTITLGTAQPGRTLTVVVLPKTIVRRYSTDSVKFADAKMSTLDQISPGDQMRARGDRSGNTITADEVVAGTFRNIAGTVSSVDVGSNTVTLTDLATRKVVTLRLTPETQAHKLPPEMAQRIAARFKSAAAGGSAGAAAGGSSTAGDSARQVGGSGAGGEGQSRSDLSALLQRAPNLSLADLKKGDAVMVVATEGTGNSATAVTLLSGVEPLLEASPSASQGLLSASWNLGGGGAEAATAQ